MKSIKSKTDEDEKFHQPYISLKFGGIKSINFNNNEEALKVHDQFEQGTPEQQIATIKAYNGNFYFWWDNKWGTKQQAIDYILNYERES